MATTTAQSVGARLEQIALDHLRKAGLKLVARNFRCRVGEIDLVMLDQACLVFVEVRYRKPSRFASALESVDEHKQRKLAKAALFFIGRHQAFREHTLRFDVIAFDGPAYDRYTLQWLRDAFRPE